MHSKTSYGFVYYDKYLRVPRSATYSDLFLLFFSRAFGDLGVSDTLVIPRSLRTSTGERVEYPNSTLLQKIYNYLQKDFEISVTEDFYTVDIGYLRNYLVTLGFSYGSQSVLPEIKLNEFVSDYMPQSGISVHAYYERYYDNASMYQMALGFLYGLSQLGYGDRPFSNLDNPAEVDWYQGNYRDLLISCRTWFAAIPLYTKELGSNSFCPNSGTDKPQPSKHTVLSPTHRLVVLYDSGKNLYSLDSGKSWISATEFTSWCKDNAASIVTSYIGEYYLGDRVIELPLSDWHD